MAADALPLGEGSDRSVPERSPNGTLVLQTVGKPFAICLTDR
jgi:hypothetical protein